MYFTNGSSRAFEMLMRGKPSFDRYENGGCADCEDCNTYTLDTESGASLRAVGWTNAGLAGGKVWTGSRRPAQPLYPAQMKYRYEKRLNGG